MKPKVKTLVDLVTLGTSLYVLTKDRELMEKLSRYASEGRQKIGDLLGGDDDEEEKSLLARLGDRLREGEREIEKKIEDMVDGACRKLDIARADELRRLREEIAALKAELAQKA